MYHAHRLVYALLSRRRRRVRSAARLADDPDLAGGKEGVGTANFGVGQHAVAEQEPPRPPPLAVVGPLTEHPRHRAGRHAAARCIDGLPLAAGGRSQLREGVPGPTGAVVAADPGALQCNAAERVHLPNPHSNQFC